jgi:hypothetical protein
MESLAQRKDTATMTSIPTGRGSDFNRNLIVGLFKIRNRDNGIYRGWLRQCVEIERGRRS